MEETIITICAMLGTFLGAVIYELCKLAEKKYKRKKYVKEVYELQTLGSDDIEIIDKVLAVGLTYRTVDFDGKCKYYNLEPESIKISLNKDGLYIDSPHFEDEVVSLPFCDYDKTWQAGVGNSAFFLKNEIQHELRHKIDKELHKLVISKNEEKINGSKNN